MCVLWTIDFGTQSFPAFFSISHIADYCPMKLSEHHTQAVFRPDISQEYGAMIKSAEQAFVHHISWNGSQPFASDSRMTPWLLI